MSICNQYGVFVKTKSLNNVARTLQSPLWYVQDRDRWEGFMN